MQNTQDAIEGFRLVGASQDIEAAERQLVLTGALLDLVRKP